jgi:[ribosomal protein S5]-alanine N-acetyltransferase
MTSVTTPTIETGRLLLRIPIGADVAPLAAFIEDPDFSRYIPKSKVARTSRERAERLIGIYQERWEEHPLNAMGWSTMRKSDGQFIGICGIEGVPDTADGEIDYRLGPPHWGQGYATEAARAIVRFGFEHSAWDRIVAAVARGNDASVRIVERLGFVYEKEVNYLEMAGDPNLVLDPPFVAYYALRRDQYVPDGAFYRLKG